MFPIRTAPRPEALAAAGDAAALRRVATRAGQSVEVRPRIEIAGVLEGRRSVELYAETRGSVLELGAEELDRVAAGQLLVEIDPQYLRPTEVTRLQGDSTKAREKLGWRHETRFADLVREMVAADLKTTATENGLKPGTS